MKKDQIAETNRIHAAVDDFASAMKKRLTQMVAAGYSGWDGKYPADDLREQIFEDAVDMELNGDDETTIDIANRCMMLWWRANGDTLISNIHGEDFAGVCFHKQNLPIGQETDEHKGKTDPVPWTGNLHHARDISDGWGCICNEDDVCIMRVMIPYSADHDLDRHRRQHTDPTQMRVDAIITSLNSNQQSDR